MREHGDDPVRTAHQRDRDDDGAADKVALRTVGERSDGLAIVGQQQQEEQRRRHEQRGDDVDRDGDRQQRRVRDEHDGGGGCHAVAKSAPPANVDATTWCVNNGTAARTAAIAATAATSAPSAVSNLPCGRSAAVNPLSTTALCWKKIIHGVTVAPTSAMSKVTKPAVTPPASGLHVPKARATAAASGCANIAAGTNKRLNAARTSTA